METELTTFINDTFSLNISTSNYAEIKEVLVKKLNDWINNDFNKLIHVLYRIDVSESKINQLLRDNRSMYAADILADLIIERQLEKIRTRKDFPPPESSSEEERW